MFPDLLRSGLSGIVGLSDLQISALAEHYERMLSWNRVLNLTSITDVREAVERHYCESILLGTHIDAGVQGIADIGSGAGFPGFPVAVLRPDCRVVLIESHQRKAVFLKEASRGLANVRVLAKRAEDVEDSFDLVISRAVSYRDLGRSLSRLGQRALLLTGAEEPPASLGFTWRLPVQLPWGSGRFLRISEERL